MSNINHLCVTYFLKYQLLDSDKTNNSTYFVSSRLQVDVSPFAGQCTLQSGKDCLLDFVVSAFLFTE